MNSKMFPKRSVLESGEVLATKFQLPMGVQMISLPIQSNSDKLQNRSAAMIIGAKTLASTEYRLLTDAKLLHQVKREFEIALAAKKS